MKQETKRNKEKKINAARNSIKKKKSDALCWNTLIL